MTDTPFCQRCREDFRVTEMGFTMGTLTSIDTLSKALWLKLRIVDWEDPNGRYLCGNCYFDLTDE